MEFIRQLQIKPILLWLIAAVGIGASIWSSSMLVAGFRATGSLDSGLNPMGGGVAFVAAGVIIMSTTLWYYVLFQAQRIPKGLIVLTGLIVVVLTIFASLTQLFSVTDAAMGGAFEKGAQARVQSGWNTLQNMDRTMADTVNRRIEFAYQRMQEELITGRGPRFKASEAEYNRLRQVYGAVLSTPLQRAPQGRSLADDLAGARDYKTALIGKVQIFENFSRDVGLVTPDYRSQLAKLETTLSGFEAAETGGWIDRKSLVFAEVVRKLGEAWQTNGQGDVGFSLQILLSIIPDLIQLLASLMMVMLNPPKHSNLFFNNEESEADAMAQSFDPANDNDDWIEGIKQWPDNYKNTFSSKDGSIET